MEIDTEMDTEIEMVMEIDTDIDTEILIYGHIAVANVATSPIRSRLAMTRWERRRGSRSASRGPREQKEWVPKKKPQSRLPSTDDSPASGVGEAAVAAGGVLGGAAVAAGGADAVPTLQEAVHNPEFPCQPFRWRGRRGDSRGR